MHAIVIAEPGGPDVLTWADVPDPVPGPGEVIIDVTASAINRADLMQRRGLYPPPPGAPPYPGLECSGTVSALGPGVAGWREGDQVCALLAGGGYAEKVAVPAGQLLPLPEGVQVTEAAALPEVACTVWSNVFGLARLAEGETFLVHGGAGGIGTFAIQLGRARGARVLATASSPEKLARCVVLGAEHAISYRDEDFPEVVREVTGGKGANVILDVMGASYLARNITALAADGRLVIIGLQGGTRAEIDLGQLMGKRASLHATTLRARPTAAKAAIVAEVREHVWPLIAAGTVTPVIDRVIPMRDAAAAHKVVEASAHIGKVLLVT
ncbi:MAG: NAD(P)H-quinone oxidoreductase [Micromonosporaceae bacterium]